MLMLFSPTIGAAIAARYWYLWVRCPACRMTSGTLDHHPDAAVTSLIPALSCRSCWPNAPFAELVRLSRTSITEELRAERTHDAHSVTDDWTAILYLTNPFPGDSIDFPKGNRCHG